MDTPGRLAQVSRHRQTCGDAPGRLESASQAEYAGSIPVIGSTFLAGTGGLPSSLWQLGGFAVRAWLRGQFSAVCVPNGYTNRFRPITTHAWLSQPPWMRSFHGFSALGAEVVIWFVSRSARRAVLAGCHGLAGRGVTPAGRLGVAAVNFSKFARAFTYHIYVFRPSHRRTTIGRLTPVASRC
jgi:hypothetical protein